ncbi:MAG: hypothetical protein COW03_10735 [Cytophagales bacterium CG12_big_fil_rev_8_21_14_0_65_40_12]|nr:MAG: hypothetical protein COW03_10735 [Cytophagales bacterium CG12_big_fil_rev_8_21_14_0_65_40_12]PIW05593.1 MAG: hypothetical protein COW40_03880 [Cytophagales bacterium CG17_big_fil_post_rev_8_21_14_2_50_40_13]
MSNILKDQYPLGPKGSYGVATCVVAENLVFENVKGAGNDPLAFPESFCPFLRVTKDQDTQAQRLHVVIFAPQGFVLDAKSPLVCDYMGAEFFLFVNFKQNTVDPTAKQCFVIHADFTIEFSAKINRKNVFVIPVHGDPEEGEIAKGKMGGDEEL